MVAGEVQQLTGLTGVQWVKRWLDYSTRVATMYLNTDRLFGSLLSFPWPYGGQRFSFDLGGKLRGGRLNDHSFMVEVKTYYKELDLPAEYRKFVAECYVAFQLNPERCDHLIWASFSPFQAQLWDQHRSADTIRRHLLHRENRARLFDTTSADEASEKVSEQVIFEISKRIWLLTLCQEQADLAVLSEHFDHLMKFMRVAEESR
jgi:hypothetical protein